MDENGICLGSGGTSAPLVKNLLIVAATAESDALVGLDKATGREVWRQEAAGLDSVWGTPVLVPVDDQRTDLVIAVPEEIWGLDPETGKLARPRSAMGGCSSAPASICTASPRRSKDRRIDNRMPRRCVAARQRHDRRQCCPPQYDSQISADPCRTVSADSPRFTTAVPNPTRNSAIVPLRDER